MTPLFATHAGEYLAGFCIERHFKNRLDVWVPSKDNVVGAEESTATSAKGTGEMRDGRI